MAGTAAAITLPLASQTRAQGAVVSFSSLGGSPGSSGPRNRTAFAAAVALLSRRGGGTLRVEPGLYPFSGEALLSGRNVTVIATGARFEGPSCRLTLSPQSSAISIVGLTLVDTSGARENYLLNILGSACRFRDVHLEKRPTAGGYIAYCRENTVGNVFENLSFAGSNGVFLGGRDHRITGGWATSTGGDDCWVLKSTIYPCTNIRISGFRAEGFAALMSIGSEVGRRAGVTPLGPPLVRDVLVENCVASGCSYFAYIKPGGVGAGQAAYDWQDGVVEDVTIRDCQCEDAAGERFRDGIYVSPGRGAAVRRLIVDNLQIRARAKSPAVQAVAGVYLHLLPITARDGRRAVIEDVTVSRLRCIDPEGGALSGAGRRGGPIQHAVIVEKQDPSIGRIGRVTIAEALADGMARSAVVVGAAVDGPVHVSASEFRNFAAGISAAYDQQAILGRSPVVVERTRATPSPKAPPGTRALR